jgi:hypothetical protein
VVGKKSHEEPFTARGAALFSCPNVTSHPASSFHAAGSNNVPEMLVGGAGVKGSVFSCAARGDKGLETQGKLPPGIGDDGQRDMGPLSHQSASSGTARGWVQGRGTATLSPNFSHGSVTGGTPANRVDTDEANMLDRIWPGSHNEVLHSCFVACHLTGDWMAHLPFVYWADAQYLEDPSALSSVSEWLSQKSTSGQKLQMGTGKRDREGGGRDRPGLLTEGGRRSAGINAGVNNMCNKTCSILIGPAHFDTFGGSSATAISRVRVPLVPTGPSPVLNRRLFAKRSSPTSGHPDICTIFPSAWSCTLQKAAGAHLMEEEITLLAQGEAARAAWIKAQNERYTQASRIKCVPKKGCPLVRGFGQQDGGY